MKERNSHKPEVHKGTIEKMDSDYSVIAITGLHGEKHDQTFETIALEKAGFMAGDDVELTTATEVVLPGEVFKTLRIKRTKSGINPESLKEVKRIMGAVNMELIKEKFPPQK